MQCSVLVLRTNHRANKGQDILIDDGDGQFVHKALLLYDAVRIPGECVFTLYAPLRLLLRTKIV